MMKANNMKAWTVKQLKEKLSNDLLACNTNFERSMVVAIGGKHIREFAEQLAAIRKLTPGEIAIASEYGYKA